MLSIFLAKCTCVAPPLILSSISDREFVASAGHQQRDSLDTYEEGLWLQNGVSFITLLSGGGLRCGCGKDRAFKQQYPRSGQTSNTDAKKDVVCADL